MSVYHDTSHKTVKVAVRGEDRRNVKYKCTLRRKPDSSKKDHELKGRVSDVSFSHTAYIKAQTTITCDYEGAKQRNSVKVLYKENSSSCDRILSSDVQSNGRFSLTETDRGFNVAITDVSENDAGVYWCGVESGGNSTLVGKILLNVKDITTFIKNFTVGDDFSYLCEYQPSSPIKRFLCKGEDPSTCHQLASTAKFDKTSRFSMKEDKTKSKVTITMRHMTGSDTGTYWCGAESTDRTQENQFFHRLVLTAVYPGVLENPMPWTIIIAAAASAAGLVLVLLMVLVCKRCQHSKKTKDGEAGTIKEDTAYAEILELPQQSNPGTALKTVYTTADFPSNLPSASQLYSNIHFNPDPGAGAPPVIVTFPKYSAANHQPRLPQDPFYSTVTHPRP
ncbi:uncharacterized protein V6R79_002203 [Siganus canaliculatus]